MRQRMAGMPPHLRVEKGATGYARGAPRIFQERLLTTFLTGVDGLVTVIDTGCAFLGGGVDRLNKDLKPEFLVLFNHLRKARLIGSKPLLPAFFLQCFFSAHKKRDARLS